MSPSNKPRKIVETEESTHYVSARKQRRPKGGSAQPPLTPMIDVTFQLLIFFILTTTFRAAEGQIPGSLPGLGISDQPAKEVLTIRVTHADPISRKPQFEHVEGNRIFSSGEELYSFLESWKNQNSQWNTYSVVIDPGVSTQWRHAAEAWNQAVRADFEKIAFKPMS
ncbi:MAG: ExbD/TolR family protein [Phycisphaerae bacterium]